MGIRFECPNGHKLHVKSFLAGKKGLCPECGVRIVIPGETGRQGSVRKPGSSVADADSCSADSDDAAEIMATEMESSASVLPNSARSSDQVSSASAKPPPPPPPPDVQQTPPPPQDSVWFVRVASGEQYGPADQAEFDAWVQQGRIGPTSLVWREGWPDWRSAGEVIGTRQVPAHNSSDRESYGNGQIPAIAKSSLPANVQAGQDVIQIETDRPVPRTSSRTPIVVILLCLACAILLIPLVWMLSGAK